MTEQTKEETGLAKADPTAIAPVDPYAALENWDGEIVPTQQRPSTLDPNDVTGTEDIGADEIRLARLGVAQGLSYQMTPGDAQYIEGLTLFQMFNDQTSEIYGHGPLTIIPILRDVKRMQFTPRSEGGGLLDPDVPKGDPRLKWSWSTPELKASGVRGDVPPQATEFIEFVVLICRKGKAPEPILLSLAQKNKANRLAADKLTSVVKLSHAPIYASVFSIDTHVPAKNAKGQVFGAPTIRSLGFIPKDTPIGAALFAHAENFHNSLEGKTVVVQRADDDIDDSMAGNPESPSGSSEM